MRTLFLDFETYYDTEYSVRKMTPPEYIHDTRFETIGLAVMEGWNGEPYWIEGPEVQEFFSGLDPEVTCTVTFNALFDNAIMSWKCNFVPKLMIDMLGVARATLGARLKSLSLDSLGKYLGFGGKLEGGNPLAKAKGLRLEQIKAYPPLYHDYVAYALQDVKLTGQIFQRLVLEGNFPRKELLLADMVLRAAVQPQFVMDKELLAESIQEEVDRKHEKLALAMMVGGVTTKSELMSNQKFAEALQRFGVEPPRKVSPATGNVTWAFSKSDHAFMELLDHDDDGVRILMDARLDNKTTIAEKRAEKLLKIANLPWPVPGLMPIPLRYSGAHTQRLSGDWKINWQNPPKKGPDGKPGKLRRALTAQKGYKVLVTDAAQIEARLVAWTAGERTLLEQFEKGEDPYANFASKVFGYPVNKKDNPDERFIGKTGILGLGYVCGHSKFQNMVRAQSRQYIGKEISLSMDEAQRIVDTYRQAYSNIKSLWNTLNEAIPSLAGVMGPITLGPVTLSHHRDTNEGQVLLPSGLKLYYPDLAKLDNQWYFSAKGTITKLYGGSLLENITQALARIIVMDAAMRIYKRTGYRFALQVHDELVYVVPDEEVEGMCQIMTEEMVRRPAWATDLPLAVDPVGIGQSYGEAK
jgi:DNA polymerase